MVSWSARTRGTTTQPDCHGWFVIFLSLLADRCAAPVMLSVSETSVLRSRHGSFAALRLTGGAQDVIAGSRLVVVGEEPLAEEAVALLGLVVLHLVARALDHVERHVGQLLVE